MDGASIARDHLAEPASRYKRDDCTHRGTDGHILRRGPGNPRPRHHRAGCLWSGLLGIDAKGDDDTIIGGAGVEWVYGGDGEDAVYGRGGDDRVVAGAGTDTVYGGSGMDHIYSADLIVCLSAVTT